MTTIRKFFDTAIGEPATQAAPPSIAEMMAKHGVKSQSDVPVAPPILINQEKKEEPIPAPEVPQAAMATETSNAEPANPEPPKPVEEPKPVQSVQAEPEPVKVPSWQEVLKNQQPDTVLKELGYDDKVVSFMKEMKELDPKVVGLIQSYKEGKHLDYLRELSTDYTTMSAEDVMRNQLKQEYPKASPQQIETLFKREVVKAYSLDSEDEDEAAEGRMLLEAKADKFRDSFIQRQQEFLLPKPPEPKASEPDNSAQEALQQKQFEEYKSQLTNHQYSREILNNKAISIGEGDEKFNFPVDPNALTEVLLDSEKWTSSIFDIKQDGTYSPKVEHQMLIAAVAKYGMDFINELAKHFKTVGSKAVIAPIENAVRPDGSLPSAPESAPKTPAEAMARMGRFNG